MFMCFYVNLRGDYISWDLGIYLQQILMWAPWQSFLSPTWQKQMITPYVRAKCTRPSRTYPPISLASRREDRRFFVRWGRKGVSMTTVPTGPSVSVHPCLSTQLQSFSIRRWIKVCGSYWTATVSSRQFTVVNMGGIYSSPLSRWQYWLEKGAWRGGERWDGVLKASYNSFWRPLDKKHQLRATCALCESTQRLQTHMAVVVFVQRASLDGLV